MKVLKCITVVVFCLVILLPLFFFNFESNSVSEIDNRLLAEKPLSNIEGDVTKSLETYIGDRIGFRDEMILGYTVLNDRIFNKMVHPSYTYGKDGYVFGAGITTSGMFSDYHIAFADMVMKLQQYCEERNVPFLFVFNPAKPAVYSEYLKDGIAYSRDWVDNFFAELDKRGVNYIDNTETMLKAKNEGIVVYNKKYDANHWNYMGAFYGTNAILEKLKERIDSVHVNSLSEFEIQKEKVYSLPVSNFPIDEEIPKTVFSYKCTDNSKKYAAELELHSSYRTFGSYVNEERKKDDSPSALVFQGSYMNGFGYEYLINAFGEYTRVHDYQNVINMPYYFNIFKPDVVVFEVAEYTFSETYFEHEAMKNISYNKPLNSYSEEELTYKAVSEKELFVEMGEALTKISWSTGDKYENVWLVLNEEYDMCKTETGYTVTVKTEDYKKYKSLISIAYKN